jgi:spore photoproduct lyase
MIVIRANIEDILKEIDSKISKSKKPFWRIGTGELSDSLSLDHLTNITSFIVPFFNGKEDVLFEFKTKTNQVEGLLSQARDHKPKNIMVSWTLNTQEVILKEEHGTPSLAERLEAAGSCQKAGYPVAFHFDPLIYSKNWEKLYKSVIDQIFSKLDNRFILWFSLGTFRFSKNLRAILKKRFPESSLVHAELVKAQDGKMRYPQNLRISMYRFIANEIRAYDRQAFIYLCMESPEIWERVFGWRPKTPFELDNLFYETYSKKAIYPMFVGIGP